MITKTKKSKARASLTKSMVSGNAMPGRAGFDGTEIENVQYFLRGLNQISLALNALGYTAEGDALIQVKLELQQRIFGTPEPSYAAPSPAACIVYGFPP